MLIGSAVIVASGPLSAQSLADALSGPASRAARTGTWATGATLEIAVDRWRPTIAKPLLGTHAGPPHCPVPGGRPEPVAAPKALHGLASYYGRGELTAAGERFDPTAMTAAHRSLPFGTRVRVIRVDNGDSVIVRINDRGPFTPGRVIDLSERAAQNLGMTGTGLADVRLEVLGQ
jgi:rare lipoprotein A